MSKPSDSNLSAGPPNLPVRHKNTEAVFTGCVETVELDDGYGLCYPDTPAAKFRKINTAPYDPLQPHVRRKLEDHFAAHNARLAEFLGTDPLW